MAKANGKKRTQSPAQKRAQADFKAFYADHGHGPAQGQSIKGYAASRSAPKSKGKKGGKKGKGKPKPLLVRIWRSKPMKVVRKHPVLAAFAVGGTTAVAHPKSREALGNAGRNTVAAVRTKFS